jgi:hypothetical protein
LVAKIDYDSRPTSFLSHRISIFHLGSRNSLDESVKMEVCQWTVSVPVEREQHQRQKQKQQKIPTATPLVKTATQLATTATATQELPQQQRERALQQRQHNLPVKHTAATQLTTRYNLHTTVHQRLTSGRTTGASPAVPQCFNSISGNYFRKTSI